MTIAKPRSSYGSTRKLALVSASDGSGWRGEIMNFERQGSELVFLNQTSKEELAQVVVELIKDSSELRRVILEVVWNCPNIVTQV